MKRIKLLGLALWLASGAWVMDAAEPAPAVRPEGVVELPPLIVSETAGATKWRYVKVRDDEYLSRTSDSTTRAFIERREQLLHRLRTIVPDAFLVELPSVFILSDQGTAPKAGDLVAQDVLRAEKSPPTDAAPRIQYLPNLGLDGRDVFALFAYVDAGDLAGGELGIAPGYLRFRLERRTPTPPPWLVEGIIAANDAIKRRVEGVTLWPMIWLTPDESREISRYPATPRALLPMEEMFAPDALRGAENSQPRRVKTLQAQVALFLRWGIDPRNHVREAFWRFAQRASEQRVTEALCVQCFGFGLADLGDRLNDYLPLALKEPLRLEPGPQPPFSAPEPREATREEIARLSGTWERLEIPYVQHAHPDFAGRYIVQARQTLRRLYNDGNREAWLQAELGLCEIDAGEVAVGQPLLEAAWAAGPIRPRASHELARLRFSALMRGPAPAANRMFSTAELAPVVEPLRRTLEQTPQLPEVYGLLADALLRARDPLPASDVDALARGAKFFVSNPAVSYRLALALARFGKRAEAIELLTNGIDYVTDDTSRARYAQLRVALAKGPGPVAH